MSLLTLLIESRRMLLISFTGQTMGYILYNALFEKRRSMCKLIFFISGKTILILIVDVMIKNNFPEADWTSLLSGVTGVVVEIFLCVMFMYTFQGGLVKCITGMMIGEAIISFIWMFCLVCVNAIEGRKDLFMIYGEFQTADLLLPVIGGIVFSIFYHFTYPFLKKFRTYEIKHTFLLGTVYISYFSVVQGMPFVDLATNEGILITTVYPFLILDICIVAGALEVYGNYRRDISEENDFLKLQLRLMEVHYAAIQSQSGRMKECQQMMDEQMEEIEQKSNKADSNKRIVQYLENLKEEYEKINAGTYCEDWLVDAVLHCQSNAAREVGIETECLMRGYRRGIISERMFAQLLFLLFDFAIRENKEHTAGVKRRISVQIGTVLNLVSIVFFTTAKEGKTIPRRQLQKYLKDYNGIMTIDEREEGVLISLSFYG